MERVSTLVNMLKIYDYDCLANSRVTVYCFKKLYCCIYFWKTIVLSKKDFAINDALLLNIISEAFSSFFEKITKIISNYEKCVRAYFHIKLSILYRVIKIGEYCDFLDYCTCP